MKTSPNSSEWGSNTPFARNRSSTSTDTCGNPTKSDVAKVSKRAKSTPTRQLPHHLGHGFGLYPHEAPHLNPHWNDTFEEGDTFTAEPGLYADDLQAGIRLEQDYLVTANGVERLTNFPLDL